MTKKQIADELPTTIQWVETDVPHVVQIWLNDGSGIKGNPLTIRSSMETSLEKDLDSETREKYTEGLQLLKQFIDEEHVWTYHLKRKTATTTNWKIYRKEEN